MLRRMSDDGFCFHYRLDVRFRDCDAMGHVNHAVYFTYFEQCRFALWRRMGGATGLPGSGTILVHAECDYRAPAFINDALDIRLKVGDIGRSSFAFHYLIEKVATGQRLAEGKTVNVAYDYAAGQTMPIPDMTRQLLEQARDERWS